MACEVVELNAPADHVHLVVLIPPKLSVSTYRGRVKGKSAAKRSCVLAHRLANTGR